MSPNARGVGTRRAALAAVALLAAMPAAAQRAPQEIAAQAQAALLVVEAFDANGEKMGAGTGFVVREDGAFITNYHVVEEAASLRVTALNGEPQTRVLVLATDAPRDLVLLQLPGAGMPALALGDDAQLRTGDAVYVMGNPIGMAGSFAGGMISARREVEGVAMLQVTTPISPGTSGGPLMDAQGRVVGVATLFAEGATAVGLAVPVQYVRGLLAAAGEPRAFAAGALGKAPLEGLVMFSSRLGGDAGERDPAEWEPEAQVLRHFESIRPLLRLQGLAPAYPLEMGSATPTELRSYEFRLEAGVRYMIAAYCDRRCRDVDLEIFDGAQNLVQ